MRFGANDTHAAAEIHGITPTSIDMQPSTEGWVLWLWGSGLCGGCGSAANIIMPADLRKNFCYAFQTGSSSHSVGKPMSFNVSKRCFSSNRSWSRFLKELPGLMVSTIYLIAESKAKSLFCFTLVSAVCVKNGREVLYGIFSCTTKRRFQIRL